MVRDTKKDALRDSEGFLQSAKDKTKPNRVRMTNLIHSVIRANDALLLHFGRDKPSNHEDAASKFTSVIDDKGMVDKYGRYEKNIKDLLGQKTPAEYTGKSYSNKKVKNYQKKAERFVRAIEEITG